MSLPRRIKIDSPQVLDGTIRAPGSKSYTHRAYLTALLKGKGTIYHPLISEDTEATRELLTDFHSRVRPISGGFEIESDDVPPTIGSDRLNAGESGTLFRFLIPLCSFLSGPGSVTLTGEGSLRTRDHSESVDSIKQMDRRIEYLDEPGRAPLKIFPGQPLPDSPIQLEAYTTSQHLSGWMLTLATHDGGLIILDRPPVSAPYVKMTAEVLKDAGCDVDIHQGTRLNVGTFSSDEFTYDIPGDFSSSAFFLVGAAITGGSVTVNGLRKNSTQADRKILKILRGIGAEITWKDKRSVSVSGVEGYSGFTVDASNCPDLVPILAVLGSFARGTVVIENISHLTNKESNRIEIPCRELGELGVNTSFGDDNIVIEPTPSNYTGGQVEAHNDHRVAMALSIFGCRVGNLTVEGADCVAKSYPQFYQDLSDLGCEWTR